MAGPVATRDKIVGSALELFWERGYEATGISDIVERAGVRSGSLYHFFENKEHVLVAVLADYRNRLLTTAFKYRCPIGSLALEVGPVSERARVLIDANFAAWRAAIASQLSQLRLRRGNDPASLAAFVLTVMEGGVMQAAAHRSAEPYDESIAHLRAYLTSLLK